MNRFFFVQAFLLLIDVYVYQALKTLKAHRFIKMGFWVGHFLLYGFLGYLMFTHAGAQSDLQIRGVVGWMFLGYIPKLVFLLTFFLEDVVRLPIGFFQKWKRKETLRTAIPSRRTFLAKVALGAAVVMEGALLKGFFKGRYDFQVHKIGLKFPNLPKAFNGFKVLQISDMHIGSFDNKEAVQKGIDLINAQNADVVLFTGDFVNHRAFETEGWESIFKGIQAKEGKFAVLGNHDYGDYRPWENLREKNDNFQQLADFYQQAQFKLLKNETNFIQKDGERLGICGVENWGEASFSQKYADLPSTFNSVLADDFCILMSHDPSHWRGQILPFDKHIPLTLSGHTHGLQMGIEIGGFKFSPVQWRYPEWAGLYEDPSGQKLYVNRGFGFIGLPARVGILPEITVITLECG